MGSVLLDFHAYKVRRPYLSKALMDRIIPIREEGERDLVLLCEHFYFIGGITYTDPYYFEPPFVRRLSSFVQRAPGMALQILKF